ncbi:hypothetical protein ACFL1G_00520 [Planctomycetota bacterium]
MSTLTKILIILLTLSSFFLCGIVVTYVSNAEDYRQKYDDVRLNRDELQQNLNSLTKLTNETIDKTKQEKNDLTEQIASLKTTNDQLQLNLKNAEREKSGLLQKVNDWTSVVADFRATNEQQGLTLENTLRKLEGTEAEKIKQEKELNETSKILVEKMAIVETLQNEKKRLLEEKTELEKRLNLILQPTGKVVAPASPVTPRLGVVKLTVPEPVAQEINLQGLVTDVDLENSMVGISIGSADGVSEGMTFHVIRAEQFICDILIVDVDTEQAVGVLEVMNKQPKVGDKVSTNF